MSLGRVTEVRIKTFEGVLDALDVLSLVAPVVDVSLCGDQSPP
jgi:hypothetical protein